MLEHLTLDLSSPGTISLDCWLHPVKQWHQNSNLTDTFSRQECIFVFYLSTCVTLAENRVCQQATSLLPSLKKHNKAPQKSCTHHGNNGIFLSSCMTHSSDNRRKPFLPTKESKIQTLTCLWVILSKCWVHTCLTASLQTLKHKSKLVISSLDKLISHTSCSFIPFIPEANFKHVYHFGI